MAEPDDDLQELLIGTWTAIALVAEATIRAGAIQREDLLESLADAEAIVKGSRRIALSAITRLLVRLGQPNRSRQQPTAAAERPRARCPGRGCARTQAFKKFGGPRRII